MRKAASEKDFKQSVGYFLGAWANAFLTGQNSSQISAQFEAQWPKGKIDVKALSEEQKAHLTNVKIFGKRLLDT